jgi:hypothetical protein
MPIIFGLIGVMIIVLPVFLMMTATDNSLIGCIVVFGSIGIIVLFPILIFAVIQMLLAG